jgi:ABC-type amino acid transport system permease subunit
MISKDNILNTFILKSPLESQPLRICLLLFAYTSDLALNTLFYFSDNISDKYHYSGNNLFWYTLFNNILISVISTLLSLILGSVLQVMTDSKSSIEDEFKEEEKKMREDNKYSVSEERKKEIFENIKKSLKCLKIKMIIFVILDFLILLFFFYFVSSFCEVYQSTQTSWISDAVVSIIISFPIELAIDLAITIVYKLSLKHKWELLYKIAKLLA